MIDPSEFDSFRLRFKNSHWLDGNCYYFAVILKDRFPEGDIIYVPIAGHFMLRVGVKAYDFAGIHSLPETYYVWDELKEFDPSLYERIRRDCIVNDKI